MSMGVHHPYSLDLCAYDEDPSQLIIRPGWDAPHVRCSPRTFCAWPCLLRQVGTVLGSPYDCVVANLAYANPGSRQVTNSLSGVSVTHDEYRTFTVVQVAQLQVINQRLLAWQFKQAWQKVKHQVNYLC